MAEQTGPRKRYIVGRGAHANVVFHGHMSHANAETIWNRTMDRWGVVSSSEETRDEFFTAIATLLIQGTSKATDYENQLILVDGREYAMSVLVDVCAQFTTQPNPERVFLRSFRSGIIPFRTYSILLDPANDHLRSMAMTRYGVPEDKVHLAFDMAEYAIEHIPGGQGLIPSIRAIKRTHLTDYRDENVSRGVSSSVHDTSNRFNDTVARTTGGGISGGANMGQQSVRMGFDSIR